MLREGVGVGRRGVHQSANMHVALRGEVEPAGAWPSVLKEDEVCVEQGVFIFNVRCDEEALLTDIAQAGCWRGGGSTTRVCSLCQARERERGEMCGLGACPGYTRAGELCRAGC